MSDAPVRTKVLTAAGRRELQEYLIVDRGEPDVVGVELEGIESAEPSREVLDALRAAEAIVIGPSNPVISIGPILAVPGMREAIAASPAPVVAVSPYVAGEVVKGPTDRFMQALGRPGDRRRRRLALRRADRRRWSSTRTIPTPRRPRSRRSRRRR